MAILPDTLVPVLRITLVGQNQGATWMNTFYLQGTQPFGADPAPVNTLLTTIFSGWGTNIAPLCNPLVSLTEARAADLTSRTALTTAITPTAVPGTRTGTPLPTSAAMVLSWKIARRYRGGHPRVYIPAGNVADVTNGRTWAGAFVTSARAAATAWYTALDGLSISTNNLDLICLSYYDGSHKTPTNPHPAPVLRPNPVPFHVVSANVRTRVDTQRRRLGKETS